MERHQGKISEEDADMVRASKKLFVRGIRCIECGSEVYAFRDTLGRAKLVEHTDRRTVGPK
jgi:hypothetical protein